MVVIPPCISTDTTILHLLFNTLMFKKNQDCSSCGRGVSDLVYCIVCGLALRFRRRISKLGQHSGSLHLIHCCLFPEELVRRIPQRKRKEIYLSGCLFWQKVKKRLPLWVLITSVGRLYSVIDPGSLSTISHRDMCSLA